MSHELRTPLNAIIGYSEMLQEEAEELADNRYLDDLRKIHGAGKHLLALINEVLDLGKLEAGKMTLYLEDFDVGRMVQEIVTTVRPLVSKNSNTLEVDCPPDIGSMRADLTKVRQTIFNLLSNATKFTEKGLIKLQLRREGREDQSRITFSVSDTGIGMSPDIGDVLVVTGGLLPVAQPLGHARDRLNRRARGGHRRWRVRSGRSRSRGRRRALAPRALLGFRDHVYT
jgi:signal transduction histidine kinase